MSSMKKALVAAGISFCVSSTAFAADQGHGKVTFTGSIIDSPCSITPESVDQTVDLGSISKATLVKNGKSTPRNFSIGLENCSFGEPATKNKVQVTFTGMQSVANNGLLGIHGSAAGASIAIVDGSGSVIKLGQPSNAQTLSNGSNTLSFAAYLQGDGADDKITEGDFQSVADFTLAYN